VPPHYRHTQLGWVIIGSLLPVAALELWLLPGTLGFTVAAVVLLGLLLLGSLSVEVGADALRVWFGPGLVRRRIALADISGFRAVRNPWYAGWGIRLLRGGVLWNVSGLDAVELDLPGGRRIRVGTDEPRALVAALERASGKAASSASSGQSGADSARTLRWPLVIVGLVLALVGFMLWAESRPPEVQIGPNGLHVRSLVYSATVAPDEVVAVSLEPGLPPIRARTNGFAAGSALRGHFRVAGLGDGQLFLERGHPPYVLLRLRHGYVVVGFRDAGRTRALYAELAAAWPGLVAPAPAPAR